MNWRNIWGKLVQENLSFYPKILTEGRVNTADLLIKVASFVKKVNNIFSIKRS